MGSTEIEETPPTIGLINFTNPDPSAIPASERAYFTQSPSLSTSLLPTPLHSIRTSHPPLVPGGPGLDVQGFTLVNHHFSLSDAEIFEGRNAEDVYAKECVELVCQLTGAKRGVVHNIDIRQKEGELDLSSSHEGEQGGEKLPLKGCVDDEQWERLPRDKLFVGGRDANNKAGQAPSRMAHIDLSVQGSRDTLRWARQDMYDMAEPIFAAEARKAAGEKDVRVPRFAAYSVWRPLFSPPKRDPLAVCDYRTLNPSTDLTKVHLRLPAQLSPSGDYILEQYRGLPPPNPSRQKWYWVPEQKPEEVLVIKFCDSAAEEDGSVAGGCLHISPILEGREKEEVRRSIEARVYVVWD